jgi:hypothetical protein
MSNYDLLLLIWIHFIADFVLQSNWIATNKSSKPLVLALHSAIYMAPMVIFGVIFALVNGALHFLIDFVTSNMTSRYHNQERRHAFFVTIGADQAIHLSLLVMWYSMIGRPIFGQ